MKKTELLKLPHRDWKNDKTEYDALYIFPTQLMHESGYARIAVVGIVGDTPKEICAMPDDLILPAAGEWALRMDSEYRSGVLHLWSSRHKFTVSDLSSSEIKLVSK